MFEPADSPTRMEIRDAMRACSESIARCRVKFNDRNLTFDDVFEYARCSAHLLMLCWTADKGGE